MRSPLKREFIRERLLEIVAPRNILEQEPMWKYTTFHAGGPAEFLVSPETEEEVSALILLCSREEIPWMLLGRGSNLLVSDAGYDGIMISLRSHFREVSADADSGILTAQGGALLSAAANCACEAGLTGLEFAHGIPGTVGGGTVMNAGAYGGELCQVIRSVRALRRDGGIEEVPAEAAEFGYRRSRFKREGMVVLSCTMQLEKGDPAGIRETMSALDEKRRAKQPLEYYSAGSTFKRPEGYYAGQLIESAGLKGYARGDAEVSEKHAGFVINRGNATANDIRAVCEHVRRTVREVHGVELEMEVIPVGIFPEEGGV